jgi:RNA polymerase sigma-70 factor, ECF subfamily
VLLTGLLCMIDWGELREGLVRFVAPRVALADVDDVVHNALVRIHGGVANVRDEDRLSAWIYQVARSAIVDHYRRTPRSGSTAPIDDDHAQPLADDESAFRGLARCIAPFVANLPPAYRQALSLVELEGVTQIEAASRLGIPVSTMKSRVQRGRARLRDLLEACCAIAVDARGHVIETTPRKGTCTGCKPQPM